MQQYFSDQALPEIKASFSLAAAEAHHLFTVMRAQAGTQVHVVFADQKLALAEVNADLATLTCLAYLTKTVELPLEVTLAVGLPKGDKLELITQKVTELGAHALLAFPAQWSVTKLDAKKAAKKTERLQKIAKGAAEQSKRLQVPTVKLLDSLKALTDQFAHYDRVLIAYEEAAKTGEVASFVQQLAAIQKGQKLLLIFGSEGGLSPQEIDTFTQNGAVVIGLGPRIMRAETAPMYALAAISFYWELLKG
jgi:16S rRNA (uracil1498-N3)-methyltransferase